MISNSKPVSAAYFSPNDRRCSISKYIENFMSSFPPDRLVDSGPRPSSMIPPYLPDGCTSLSGVRIVWEMRYSELPDNNLYCDQLKRIGTRLSQFIAPSNQGKVRMPQQGGPSGPRRKASAVRPPKVGAPTAPRPTNKRGRH